MGKPTGKLAAWDWGWVGGLPHAADGWMHLAETFCDRAMGKKGDFCCLGGSKVIGMGLAAAWP